MVRQDTVPRSLCSSINMYVKLDMQTGYAAGLPAYPDVFLKEKDKLAKELEKAKITYESEVTNWSLSIMYVFLHLFLSWGSLTLGRSIKLVIYCCELQLVQGTEFTKFGHICIIRVML